MKNKKILILHFNYFFKNYSKFMGKPYYLSFFDSLYAQISSKHLDYDTNRGIVNEILPHIFPKNLPILYDCSLASQFKEFCLNKREDFLKRPALFHSLLKEMKQIFLLSEYRELKQFLSEEFQIIVDRNSGKMDSLRFQINFSQSSGPENQITEFFAAMASNNVGDIKNFLKLHGYTKKIKENGYRALYKNEKECFQDYVDEIFQKYYENLEKYKDLKLPIGQALDALSKHKLISEEKSMKFKKNSKRYQNDYEISLQSKAKGNQIIEEEFLKRGLKIKLEEKKLTLKNFQGLFDILKGFDFQKLGIENPSFIYFGSFKSGFALKASDIDTSILTNSAFDERELLRLLLDYLEEYKKSKNLGYQIESRISDNIRIPLIKFSEKKENKLEFKADITVNNVLGVANSSMLKVYSKIDKRCKNMGLLLKNWAKKWGITSEDSLSSYALILMMIYFLQMKKILPSVQRIAKENRKKGEEKPLMKIKRTIKNRNVDEFKTDLDFEKDLVVIKNYMITHKFPENNQGMLELLLEFFNFYSDKGAFHKYHMKVDIKSGNVQFCNILAKEYETEKQFLFSVKDPFDKKHNPGDRVRKLEKITELKHKIDTTINELENENFEETRYKKIFDK